MIGNLKQYFLRRKPVISVIVANYNNGDYLEECLDSVLSQSCKNIELIVCDDSSTDDSLYILEKYSKDNKNIKVLHNSSNIGVSRTRHRAIQASTGKYITTLDSDDYYTNEEKLEKELELIAKYKRLGKEVIAFSNVDVVDKEGKRVSSYQGGNVVEGNLLSQILTRDCMIPRDFTFTKYGYFAVGGFDPNLSMYEDWDLKIRLADKYEFFYTGISGVAYRRKGSGLSYATKQETIDSMKEVFGKNIHLISNRKNRAECLNAFNAIVHALEKRAL